VAGGVPIPLDGMLSEMGVAGFGGNGFGVFGKSDGFPGVQGSSGNAAGVSGGSTKGIGVAGASTESNGGYFASAKVAQLHLEPLKTPLDNPNGNLPGRAGDLLVLRTTQREQFVTLWFCRMGGDNVKTMANWLKIA
jgi:hypothetical protein